MTCRRRGPAGETRSLLENAHGLAGLKRGPSPGDCGVFGAYKTLTAHPGFCLHPAGTVGGVAEPAADLRRTSGYLVSDANGRPVGRVERPMYGKAPDVPDALAVRSGFFARRRRLVPAEAIAEIDGSSRVIDLSVERDALQSFL